MLANWNGDNPTHMTYSCANKRRSEHVHTHTYTSAIEHASRVILSTHQLKLLLTQNKTKNSDWNFPSLFWWGIAVYISMQSCVRAQNSVLRRVRMCSGFWQQIKAAKHTLASFFRLYQQPRMHWEKKELKSSNFSSYDFYIRISNKFLINHTHRQFHSRYAMTVMVPHPRCVTHSISFAANERNQFELYTIKVNEIQSVCEVLRCVSAFINPNGSSINREIW